MDENMLSPLSISLLLQGPTGCPASSPSASEPAPCGCSSPSAQSVGSLLVGRAAPSDSEPAQWGTGWWKEDEKEVQRGSRGNGTVKRRKGKRMVQCEAIKRVEQFYMSSSTWLDSTTMYMLYLNNGSYMTCYDATAPLCYSPLISAVSLLLWRAALSEEREGRGRE